MNDTYGMTYEEEAEHLREIVVPDLKDRIEQLEACNAEHQSVCQLQEMLVSRLEANVEALEAALNKLRIWCSEEPSLSSTDIIELLGSLENKDE